MFLRYGRDLVFQRWRLLGNLHHSMQRWVWQLPEDVVELFTPAKVCLMLEELGPTYVKMGQIVSSQASVIPDEWEVELEKLQSDVPPFPADEVREILQEELGATPEMLFAALRSNSWPPPLRRRCTGPHCSAASRSWSRSRGQVSWPR